MKMKLAAVVNIVGAVCSLLCFGFILLDVSVLHWTTEESKDLVGLGVAIVIALFLMFDLPATGLNSVFQFVCGGLMLAYERRGKGVHKVLRVFAVIVGILAMLVHAFFAYTFLDSGCVLWGILTAISALSALLSFVLLAVAHREG